MKQAKNFVLMGAAGYVAPKHMEAISKTGNHLLAAFDKSDSVGILDNFFPDSDFFMEYERFDRHIDKLIRSGVNIDYFSICTPNYLHDSHIRFGLKHHANVICEKPLVLNSRNLDGLIQLEKESEKKVNCILQLRLHPELIKLKKELENNKNGSQKTEVNLTYITSRGKWYYSSWKSDVAKSGGVATNIGIHFFDMLSWLFGNPISTEVHLQTHDRVAGFFEFENARVKWFMSIQPKTLPPGHKGHSYRSIQVNGNEINFDSGFTDLHIRSYEKILCGEGFGMEDARISIEMAEQIRNSEVQMNLELAHSYCALPLDPHPFGW